jgi:glutamate synthase (NADPH/NADH) small chain
MSDTTAFLTEPRETAPRRPAAERVRDWFEIYLPFPEQKLRTQATRCMDCGVPFCHNGCPLSNLIPDWNELVSRGRWHEAVRQLHATNNFPEFTGRVCPAPCEASCVLGIDTPPVTIKQIEKTIIDRAFADGFVAPEPSATKTGKRIAVIGSGPAGLAAAQQLARAGHEVTVFEKADRIGGLLRYGIPNFKMEKHLIDRRLEQMRAEGVRFRTGAHVGVNVAVEDLRREHHALLLAGGAEQPRDLRVPGRELAGIHFAMEFLPQQNRRNAGDEVPAEQAILAGGKRVVIIGGGDTGADCLGTCHRQGALSVTQFELLPKPPDERSPATPWPLWPMQLRTEGAHEEGGARDWSVSTVRFSGDEDGNVKLLHTVRVDGRLQPIPGTEFTVEADLVLLAMGFLGPVRGGLIEQLGVTLDQRGNVSTGENYMSSVPGVFAAGDMRRGQSLVVWAIAEGRKAAQAIDKYLTA